MNCYFLIGQPSWWIPSKQLLYIRPPVPPTPHSAHLMDIQKLENMGAENQSLLEGKGVQKISVSEHINGLQYTSTKSENFVVDMECISHFVEKDVNANSRITLQRNLSRKGSLRGGERKTNFNAVNEKDTSLMATSPRASLLGASTTEKPVVLTVGPTDHSAPQAHNQMTAVTATNGAAATDSKVGARRFSFRRSSSASWTIDPRRILIFFATLSSMGTILLIYFTLSLAKHSEADSAYY